MPRERLSMRKIREILRLKWQCGLTHRQIAASCAVSTGTVSEYVRRAVEVQLPWPLPADLSDAGLEQWMFPQTAAADEGPRSVPDWAVVARELRRKGVTLRLLWLEYRSAFPDGVGYSRFCELYQAWRGTVDPTMRQFHPPGERLFVDYAGQTMPIQDPQTGAVHNAQIFVATWGASSYTYAEATLTQSLPDWLSSHVRAFTFFGGVPELVVPDNLKAGVRSPCYYEPDLNRSYLELAQYYGVAILPARVRKPRDKAKVENGVLQVERWLLAPLRHQQFFSLAEVNAALADLLTALNDRAAPGLPAPRSTLFRTRDQPALRPLPATPYQPAVWLKVRVNRDYHVVVAQHHYSVPYRFVREVVEVRLTATTVECFAGSERIASHVRSDEPHAQTTWSAHMPATHRVWHEWTPERFQTAAARHGSYTEQVVTQLLTTLPAPAQAYRACLGVLRLGDEFGGDRLEAACQRAWRLEIVSYRSLRAILVHQLDRVPLPEPECEPPPIQHPNVRGAAYYGALS